MRIGGASYYGGWALHLLGCDTHVLTSMNKKYDKLLGEIKEKIHIHTYPCSSIPEFVIKGGRAVELGEKGCVISWDYVEDTMREVSPDLVIFAPVYNEVNLHGFRNYRGVVKVVSLDIQGLTRRVGKDQIINYWVSELDNVFEYVDLVHGNIREFCFSNVFSEVIRKLREMSMEYGNYYLVSMDQRGLYLVFKDKVVFYPPHQVKVYNEVGAGDVLLAVTTYYMAEGKDVVKATVYGLAATLLKISSSSNKWFDHEKIEYMVKRIKYIELSD